MTNGDRIRQMTDEELIKMLEHRHSYSRVVRKMYRDRQRLAYR